MNLWVSGGHWDDLELGIRWYRCMGWFMLYLGPLKIVLDPHRYPPLPPLGDTCDDDCAEYRYGGD
jgi:hypothetical protein